MKLLTLNKGFFAQVDDDLFDELNKFKWRVTKSPRGLTYYAIRIEFNSKKNGGDGKTKAILLHREVIGAVKGQIVDHIDLNGLNCQRSNLRFATASQNGANKRSCATSTSKYLGVHFCKTRQKWRAQISHNKKTTNLGRFDSEIDAALRYNQAAKECHGEFARLNIIEKPER